MEPKKSISKIHYSEYKNVDSLIQIECDYVTAAIILEFVSKLKVSFEDKPKQSDEIR